MPLSKKDITTPVTVTQTFTFAVADLRNMFDEFTDGGLPIGDDVQSVEDLARFTVDSAVENSLDNLNDTWGNPDLPTEDDA